MKRFVLFFSVCLFMASCMTFNVQAQDSEDPGMILLFEEFVAPADFAQFWQVQQEAFDLFDELDFNMTIWAFQTDESSFYWAMPIKNFGGIDEIYNKMMKSHQLMKEKGFDSNMKFRNLSNMSQSVVRWNRELSHHPVEAGADEEGKFHEWTFMHLKSGHEKECAAAVQKYIDFYNSINSDYAWDIYEVVFGEHTPCWILEVQAENEVALREMESELMTEYREDLQKLWQNMVQHINSMETKKGWYLSDWSNWSWSGGE